MWTNQEDFLVCLIAWVDLHIPRQAHEINNYDDKKISTDMCLAFHCFTFNWIIL